MNRKPFSILAFTLVVLGFLVFAGLTAFFAISISKPSTYYFQVQMC